MVVNKNIRYVLPRGATSDDKEDMKLFKEEMESEIKKIVSRYVDAVAGKDERERLLYYMRLENSSFRRPANLMLTGMALGAKKDNLILLAALVQLSQEFILMADDFIDESGSRRKKPSYTAAYGKENTMNDALMLLSITWNMLVDYVNSRRGDLGYENADAIRKKFYEIGRLTYYGESMDINMLKKAGSLANISYKDCIEMTNLKTSAYTVWGPMQLGALAAGAGKSVLEAIKEIGESAGIAFQVLDDIKDITGTKEQLGKEPFSDIWESKPTIVILKVFENATEAERKEMDRIFMKSKQEKSGEEVKEIVDLIYKYGGIEYAEDEAQKWIESAAEKFVMYDSDERFRSEIKNAKYLSWLLTSIALLP